MGFVSSDNSKIRLKFFIKGMPPILITSVILLVSSGHLDWIMAWVFLGISFIFLLIGSLVIRPTLLRERMVTPTTKKGFKKWDSMLICPVIIFYLLSFFVAGLGLRFGLSGHFSLIIAFIGILLFILGNSFVIWAMTNNESYDTIVRIEGNGHTIATNGPYRYVRHPGYLGTIIYFFAQPLMLGFYWTFVPILICIILMITRTYLEDKTLRKELMSYQDYTKHVHYRLIPGVW